MAGSSHCYYPSAGTAGGYNESKHGKFVTSGCADSANMAQTVAASCLSWIHKGYCNQGSVVQCHYSNASALRAPLIQLGLIGSPVGIVRALRINLDLSLGADLVPSTNIMPEFSEISSFSWTKREPAEIAVPGEHGLLCNAHILGMSSSPKHGSVTFPSCNGHRNLRLKI